MRRRPAHRSSPATLRRLAAHHLFFDLEPRRRTPLPPLASIGLRVARLFTARHDDRDAANARVQADAAAALGLQSLRGLTRGERQAFGNFAPLLLLAGAASWPQDERAPLLALIRAKAAASELDYARRLAAQRRLCRALLRQ